MVDNYLSTLYEYQLHSTPLLLYLYWIQSSSTQQLFPIHFLIPSQLLNGQPKVNVHNDLNVLILSSLTALHSNNNYRYYLQGTSIN